jgi:plasmid stability protein
MANLQIKGIDDEIYANLKFMAASENRSVSQQVLFLVKAYLARKNHLQQIKTPAEVLLELSGSWEDPRQARELIEGLRKSRKNSEKLKEGF